MDLISVIVPIYKVEQFLDRCVQSIADQTYHNLEIILVDDGSPDNCPAMCDAWAEKDSRIQVIHKENGGLSDARNAGLKAATGQLIAFVDSDDTITPNFLEALHKALTQRNADIAECGVTYVDESGNILRQRGTANLPEMDKMEALRRLILEDGIYQTVWNKLYRREVIEGILFEKGKRHEDDFWTYQVFDRISKLATVNQPMYHYLQRGSSIMGTGYTLKRLDGLNARFLRMQYLQKYETLAVLTRQQLVMECMWYYQSTTRSLTGQEKKDALNYIWNMVESIPPVPADQMNAKLTHRVWMGMFKAAPDFTVWIRNFLRIGL